MIIENFLYFLNFHLKFFSACAKMKNEIYYAMLVVVILTDNTERSHYAKTIFPVNTQQSAACHSSALQRSK